MKRGMIATHKKPRLPSNPFRTKAKLTVVKPRFIKREPKVGGIQAPKLNPAERRKKGSLISLRMPKL